MNPGSPSEDAARLHQKTPVVDCHNDLLLLVAHHRGRGNRTYFAEHTLPELRAGGVDVQVAPVYVDEEFLPESALRRTLLLIELLHDEVERNPDDAALVINGDEIDAALAEGRIAFLLALEGCDAVAKNPELIRTLHRIGVRIASLTHFGRNYVADGSAEDPAGSRLPSTGVDVVSEMEALGMIVDVSHLGANALDHTLEIVTKPLIASHSNCRALCNHHRNLTDDHIRAIAASGGVIGVNFFPAFVDETAPTLDRLVDHAEHIVELAGPDHVGLGPDFIKEWAETFYSDAEVAFEELDIKDTLLTTRGRATDLPLFTSRLVDRGWDGASIEKILGGNFLRVFRALPKD